MSLFMSCSNCKETDTKGTFKKCSVCRDVIYCSKQCQIEHWPKHKLFCNPLAVTIDNRGNVTRGEYNRRYDYVLRRMEIIELYLRTREQQSGFNKWIVMIGRVVYNGTMEGLYSLEEIDLNLTLFIKTQEVDKEKKNEHFIFYLTFINAIEYAQTADIEENMKQIIYTNDFKQTYVILFDEYGKNHGFTTKRHSTVKEVIKHSFERNEIQIALRTMEYFDVKEYQAHLHNTCASCYGEMNMKGATRCKNCVSVFCSKECELMGSENHVALCSKDERILKARLKFQFWNNTYIKFLHMLYYEKYKATKIKDWIIEVIQYTNQEATTCEVLQDVYHIAVNSNNQCDLFWRISLHRASDYLQKHPYLPISEITNFNTHNYVILFAHGLDFMFCNEFVKGQKKDCKKILEKANKTAIEVLRSLPNKSAF